ncbi:MAG: TetR/AcrR family transcriptional regulator [Acidimicrobiia bacterium]
MAPRPPADLAPTMRRPAADLGPRAQRMIARILDATKTVFLARGYAGTSIDEIATVAEISRASFYTYFPSKRDALLALGAGSTDQAEAMFATFAADHPRRTAKDMRALVDAYMAHFDAHGAFVSAWTQAAAEDEELRRAGMRRHLRSCRILGELLGRSGADAATATGLVADSMVQRTWYMGHLYAGRVDADHLWGELADALHRLAST